MQELCGKSIRVRVAHSGVIKGILLGEKNNCLMIKDAKGTITRIPKNMVCAFCPEGKEDDSWEPIHLLACQNEKINCPGVRLTKTKPKDGTKFANDDYEEFMSSCPCRTDDCKFGDLGDITSVPRSVLAKMMNLVLFGEYPTPKPKMAKAGKTK